MKPSNQAFVSIPESQLVEILSNQKGAAPVTLSAMTDAKARKTGNPYKAIYKFAVVNGMIGVNYENAVNRQQVREGAVEGTFEAKARQWGEQVNKSLVVNGDKYYISIVNPKSCKAKPRYYGQRTDGSPVRISSEIAKQFIPEHKKATNQGTEREIVFRNYSLGNIRTVAIGGKKYRIAREATSPMANKSVTIGSKLTDENGKTYKVTFVFNGNVVVQAI